MFRSNFSKCLLCLLFLAGVFSVFYIRYIKTPSREPVSPIKAEAPKRDGSKNYFPFRSLLGFSEKQPSSGEVLGAEVNSSSSPERKESGGLLDRLIGTFSDNSRISPTPSPSPTSISTTPSPSPTLTLTPTSSPSPTATLLSSDQQAVMTQTAAVGSALTIKDYNTLYNLMGSDFRLAYSYSDFVNGLGQGGSVVSASVQGIPRIFGSAGEWAEVTVLMTQSSGITKSYIVVFHHENTWKLFGTEETT